MCLLFFRHGRFAKTIQHHVGRIILFLDNQGVYPIQSLRNTHTVTCGQHEQNGNQVYNLSCNHAAKVSTFIEKNKEKTDFYWSDSSFSQMNICCNDRKAFHTELHCVKMAHNLLYFSMID